MTSQTYNCSNFDSTQIIDSIRNAEILGNTEMEEIEKFQQLVEDIFHVQYIMMNLSGEIVRKNKQYKLGQQDCLKKIVQAVSTYDFENTNWTHVFLMNKEMDSVNIVIPLNLEGTHFGYLIIFDKVLNVDFEVIEQYDLAKMENLNGSIELIEFVVKNISNYSFANHVFRTKSEFFENRENEIQQIDKFKKLYTNLIKNTVENLPLKVRIFDIATDILDFFDMEGIYYVKKNYEDNFKSIDIKKVSRNFSFLIDEEALRQDLKSCGDDFEWLLRENNLYIKNVEDYHCFYFYIHYEDNIVGYVCVIDAKKKDNWQAPEKEVLENIGNIASAVYLKNVSEVSLERANLAMNIIIENPNLCVVVIDDETKEVVYANKAISEKLKRNIVGKKCYNDFSCSESGGICSQCILESCETSKVREFYSEKLDTWFMASFSRTKWLDGRTVILEVLIDISYEKEKDVAIQRLVWNNLITGLPNRQKFIYDLEQELGRNSASGYLLFIDIDGFRHINEIFSYAHGNKLLMEFGKYFKSIAKDVYNFSGDEFILHIKETEQINDVVKRIVLRFKENWFVEGFEHYCAMSGGVASYPEDGKTTEAILRSADIAMHNAKESQAGSIYFFNRDVDKTKYSLLRLEYRLRYAVMKDIQQFHVFFQPIVDAETGQLKSAEALARWIDQSEGMISPNDFIPIAEKLNLINIIGEHILRNACIECRKWHQIGYPNMLVNVNISVRQMFTDDLIETVKKILEETKLPPEFLVLEVTESVAISNMEKSVRILSKLREMGMKIALDDFGTGYSSLSNLKLLPLDIIKIDKTFVQDMEKDFYNYTFIKSMIELAHSAKLSVCCEGIEEQEQWESLKELKSDSLQGYYFGRPMKKESMLKMLIASKGESSNEDEKGLSHICKPLG